jgi:hypothetical protein
VSIIGLGCYGMSGAYEPADDAASIATIHRALDADLQLSMSFLYDAAGREEAEGLIIQSLTELAEDYRHWIHETARQAEAFDPVLRKAAETNLGNCRKCLDRMLTGIEVLRSDGRAMLAFRLFGPAGSGGGFAFSGDPARLSRSSRRAQMAPFPAGIYPYEHRRHVVT